MYIIIESIKPEVLTDFASQYQQFLKNAEYPVLAKLYDKRFFIDPVMWLHWIPDCDKFTTTEEAWWELKDFNWHPVISHDFKYLL